MPLEIIFLWGLRAENFIKKRKKNRRKLSLLDWWVREEESRIVGAAYLNLKRQAPTSEQLYPTKMPTSTRCPHWRLGGGEFLRFARSSCLTILDEMGANSGSKSSRGPGGVHPT